MLTYLVNWIELANTVWEIEIMYLYSLSIDQNIWVQIYNNKLKILPY